MGHCLSVSDIYHKYSVLYQHTEKINKKDKHFKRIQLNNIFQTNRFLSLFILIFYFQTRKPMNQISYVLSYFLIKTEENHVFSTPNLKQLSSGQSNDQQ